MTLRLDRKSSGSTSRFAPAGRYEYDPKVQRLSPRNGDVSGAPVVSGRALKAALLLGSLLFWAGIGLLISRSGDEVGWAYVPLVAALLVLAVGVGLATRTRIGWQWKGYWR